MTYLVTVLVALSCSAFVTRWVRDAALARGWLDASQSSRKVHVRPVPRLGGVGLVAGFLVAAVATVVSWPRAAEFLLGERLALVVIGGGVCIALLGLADDFYNVRARHKLLVQLAVALGAWALGVRVEWLDAPFGLPQDLGLLSLPITVFWIVGVINAMNLIDGLDGLAAGVALIAALVCLGLAIAAGDVGAAVLSTALAGALAGFLLFNFNPASIFMGDTGSMFLGFVLAVLSLRTSANVPGAASVLVPVVTLGLPVADTLLAMTRRAAMGRPVFSADKEHIHHRVMRRFELSHRDTVLALYAVAAVLGLAGIALAYCPAVPASGVLAVMVVGMFAALRNLGSFDRKAMEQLVSSRARNLALRRAVGEVIGKLGRARTMEHVWEGLQHLAPTLSASSLTLQLADKVESGRNDFVFNSAEPFAEDPPRVALVPVRQGGAHFGTLVAAWTDGRHEVNRDEEIGLEAVADALARALGRMKVAQGMPASVNLWADFGAAKRNTRRPFA